MNSSLLKNKYFLYATEFFAGMSVMAVELGASRFLAPYFSSSQIVWTVIIGVIMIAMAVGNVMGGRLADRDQNPGKLYKRLLIAAIWVALIPFLGRYLLMGISLVLANFVTSNFLVWAALATCLVIFAFPCVLLGTVTPSLAKYTMVSLEDNGKTVGILGALNTIGSIIGTFLPTFVTIPAVGTAATFLIFAGVLSLLSIAYFISVRTRSLLSAVSVLLLLILAFQVPGYRFAFWDKEVTSEEESIYNYLQVKDSDTQTTLSTNVLFGVQSVQMKQQELTGMYYDYALAAPVMASCGQKEESKAMILGLGSGTYASYLAKQYPTMQIIGAEIDQKIAAIATDYFQLPQTVKVAVEDGRSFLTASKDSYDVIMVDAYQDITIPFQMSSQEFFTQVKNHLTDTGVMVVNMNMKSSQEDSINDYLCDTIASVFPYVYTVPVAQTTNVEVFASMSDQLPTALEQNGAKMEAGPWKEKMQDVAANLSGYQGKDRILTDDKAPVEVLGMRALDEMIQDELDYYKEQF